MMCYCLVLYTNVVAWYAIGKVLIQYHPIPGGFNCYISVNKCAILYMFVIVTFHHTLGNVCNREVFIVGLHTSK